MLSIRANGCKRVLTTQVTPRLRDCREEMGVSKEREDVCSDQVNP